MSMSPRIPDDISAEALRLRAQGLSPTEISGRLGVTRSGIRRIIGQIKSDSAADRERRAAARKRTTNASSGILGAGSDAVFIKAHIPRKPARIIAPPDVILAAARAFNEGKISHAQLMAAIEAVA